MLPNELLAQLEAYQAGKLSETEHKSLQQALDALPEGQKEAAVYGRLWAGLDALRSEEVYELFAEREEEWQETDDTELIEWHLAGALSPDNANALKERKKNDQAFAKMVEEQEQLSTGFTALKEDDFRQNLRKWEKNEIDATAKQRDLRPNWSNYVAIAASVLVLIVAGFGWFTHQDYTDEAIVERFYQQPPVGNMMSGGQEAQDVYLTDFAEAHAALKKGDYPLAVELLENVSTQIPPADFNEDDTKYYQDNLDWSILLAKVGQGADGVEITTRLERILSDSTHTYFKKAQSLEEDLQSVWRW